MILRSRKIPARHPKEPSTPKIRSESSSNPLTPQSTSKGQRRMQPKSHFVFPITIVDDAITPSGKKHTLSQVQNSQHYLEEEDLQATPRQHSVRVRFQLDDSSPENTSVSSPVICLYSPPINGSASDGCSPPNHAEHTTDIPDCKYFSHLPEDDVKEEFNQYKFICNAQATSCELRQRKNEIPFKTRSAPEMTLVLDLRFRYSWEEVDKTSYVTGINKRHLSSHLKQKAEEILTFVMEKLQEDVLIVSSLLPHPDTDFTFLTPFQDKYYKVYLKLRPHVREFLETLCKIYEIFVFTTAKKEYAEKIVDILDPQKKLIRHRLYQDHCVCVAGHYVKDLRVLNRDLAKTVALDTVAYTLPYHITNRIPVHRWTGSRRDKELVFLLPALEQMTHVDDVRLRISSRFHVNELVAES
ncbi:CTD small phosphatase-like protein 2 isoform X2 [Pseudophryne corroboree]|uniref:CTD small phosphatase-like protein 2 isoform X2 n=1 Tax=Pseudophryne corroboree TaxID=495146 RepID=UPI00308157FE